MCIINAWIKKSNLQLKFFFLRWSQMWNGGNNAETNCLLIYPTDNLNLFAAYHCGACRPTCTQSERHGGWSMEKGPPWVCQRYKFNIFCFEPAGAPLQLRDESKSIVLIKALVCTDFKATSECTPWFFKKIYRRRGDKIKPLCIIFYFEWDYCRCFSFPQKLTTHLSLRQVFHWFHKTGFSTD